MDPVISSTAVAEWKNAIGAEHVLTDPPRIEPYARSVSGLGRVLPAVLLPASAAQVRDIVQVANRHGTPLHAVSCGRNWGLGSRLPVRDGTVLVDLSRMDRIREVNRAHGYAVVEPGVTQGQLYDYLREHDLPLVLNVTGASRDTSLIGNALERGIGYFASRAADLACLEVVLGNGTVVRTGFGHFGDAKTSCLYRHGIGPSLDGLFFQSNFGIVTAAAVHLLPQADVQAAVIARIGREELLPAFVDALVDLRRGGAIRTVLHIGNRERTTIALAPLVARELAGRGAAAREEAERIIRDAGFGPWSAVAGVAGTPADVRVAVRRIRRRLRGIGGVVFMTDARMSALKRLGTALRSVPYVRRQLALLLGVEPLYGMAKGVPSDAAMGSVYWPVGDLPESLDEDPDQGRCGMLYCLPFLPPEGEVAREAMALTREVYGRHGFVPYVTLNLVDARCLECVINLAFDRTRPEQVKAAHACNDELTAEFIRRGYPPYRVGVQSMGLVVDGQDPFWQTVRDLKKVLDPNGIISPGRYNLV